MALTLDSCSFLTHRTLRFPLSRSSFLPYRSRSTLRIVRVSANDGAGRTSSSSSSPSSSSSSYLDMWKNAVERGRKEIEFRQIVSETEVVDAVNEDDLEKKTVEFQKILQVDKEERDRIQRMQVIDRAAAAIAAAKSLLNETSTKTTTTDGRRSSSLMDTEVGGLTIQNDGGGNDSGLLLSFY